MKTVYSDKRILINFDEEKAYLEYAWLSGTGNSTVTENIDSFKVAMKHIVELRPKYVLNNNNDLGVVIDIDNQKVVAEGIAQAMKLGGGEKFAVLMPKEILAELSVDQTVDESNKLNIDRTYAINFFSDIEEARTWLLQ